MQRHFKLSEKEPIRVLIFVRQCVEFRQSLAPERMHGTVRFQEQTCRCFIESSTPTVRLPSVDVDTFRIAYVIDVIVHKRKSVAGVCRADINRSDDQFRAEFAVVAVDVFDVDVSCRKIATTKFRFPSSRFPSKYPVMKKRSTDDALSLGTNKMRMTGLII